MKMPLVLAAVLQLAVAVPALAPARAHAAGAAVPSDSLYQLKVPLTDADGRAVALDGFRGQPVIVSLFYGRCYTACPLLIASIKRIEAKLSPEARAQTRVLLVSLDPQNDTPQVLANVARAHALDAARWRLARTSEDKVQELAAVLGVRYRKLPSGVINHSTVITLLDPQGRPLERVEGVNAPAEALVARLQALATQARASR